MINNDALTSKPWWAPRIVPPQGAPNVLLIITDDAGFGVPSTFGGVIRRRRWTASPRTACVTTTSTRRRSVHRPRGAHHRTESSQCRLRRHLGTINGLPRLQQHHSQGQVHDRPHPQGQRLRHVVFGKTTTRRPSPRAKLVRSINGPSAWALNTSTASSAVTRINGNRTCFRNTNTNLSLSRKPGWNLVTGMADDAIDYLSRLDQTDPSKPFFIKYAPGATHAPHHPTEEWVKRTTTCISLTMATRTARADLREPKETRRDSGGYQLEPWPKEFLKPGRNSRRSRRSCLSNKSKSSPPTRPTAITKQVRDSGDRGHG